MNASLKTKGQMYLKINNMQSKGQNCALHNALTLRSVLATRWQSVSLKLLEV